MQATKTDFSRFHINNCSLPFQNEFQIILSEATKRNIDRSRTTNIKLFSYKFYHTSSITAVDDGATCAESATAIERIISFFTPII